MLSRIAESLFWLGRYLERADDTSRILEVNIQHLLEAPSINETLSCKILMAAMGTIPAPGDLDSSMVLETLAFDQANPSSVASSLAAARTNARGVSETISSEIWWALNSTYNALNEHIRLARISGPHVFFRYVRERSALLAGLIESTMSRDDAWRFLLLGRSLERADMIARLLDAELSAAGDDIDWVLMLRSCSAHEAFLRNYSREPDPVLAAEFLVLDRLFPRSIFRALTVAEECLEALDSDYTRAGRYHEARRRIGLIRAGLEHRRVQELFPELHRHLRSVQEGCAASAQAITARYFRNAVVFDWRPEGAGLETVLLNNPGMMEL